MGQRISRYRKKKTATASPTKAKLTTLSSPMPIEEKNDTIIPIDFFGFSPRIYWQDLKRTGVAAGVIVAVLVGIYLFTR